MARLFRCYACVGEKGMRGVQFEAEDKPDVACPKCGIKRDDAAVGHHIEMLVVMHYEPPYPHPELGKTTGIGHIACDPTKKTGFGPLRYSGEPKVVNCPACLASDAMKQAREGQFDPTFDLPI